jgi:hypothetical protein
MSGWTYPYASGVDPARGAILAALGRRPAGLEARLSWTSAERAFISIPGKVRSIQGAEAALKRPHIRDLFLRAGPGKTVRFPENNVGKCGNIISAAADRESAVAAAEDAARSILIRLEAPNRETASFLAGSGPFPPDAFTLSAGLRSLLAQVPDPEPVSAAPMPRSSLEAWILPFPEFADSRRRDYAGRSVAESLEAVQDLTGCSLKFAPPEEIPEGKIFLGRRFWAALVRGGYQGAAYLVDTIIGSM